MEESTVDIITEVVVTLNLKIGGVTAVVDAGILLVFAQTAVKDTQEAAALDEKHQIADLPIIEEILLIEGREGQSGPATVAVVTKKWAYRLKTVENGH